MKIGVILTAFQAESFIAPGPDCTIQAWFDLAPRWEGHEVKIAAVCVPFEGFEVGPLDNTRALLQARLDAGQLHHLITSNVPMKETDARGAALKWLVAQGVDTLVQWDSDEVATERDLRAIVGFVEANPWITSFRLSLRNAVFTSTTFLAEPFTPMRVHRTHIPGGYVASGFWDDNNVYYARPWVSDTSAATVRDVEMASMTIPAVVANPVHLTWLDDGPNGRSRRKIEYQTKARLWECSFRWDESKGLQFNEAYYAKRGLPLPETITL